MKNSNSIDLYHIVRATDLRQILDMLREVSSEMDNINEHLDSMIAACVQYEQYVANA